MTGTYGAVFDAILTPPRPMPLGPGTPNEPMRRVLESLDPATAFAPHAIVDRSMALCCLSGLWLLHDFLDESHAICQEIHTPEGSFWHAILHRREPDASNSKYWWRRVGRHPVFEQLTEQAARLGLRSWDPAAFVDECEAARDSGSARETLLREVQRAEWELLFAWCHRRAMG